MGADTSPPQASVYRLSRFSNCKSESLYLNAAIENRASEVLRAWMDRHVVPTFTGRILSIDVAVAQGCAALLVGDPRSDRDALLAATALVHGMTVVTRNVRHFRPMGVAVLNPWDS